MLDDSRNDFDSLLRAADAAMYAAKEAGRNTYQYYSQDALARIRLEYSEASLPFHEAVTRYAAERDDELAARLRDLLDNLRRWRDLAQRRPLAELISTVFRETGYLAYCGGLHGGEVVRAAPYGEVAGD